MTDRREPLSETQITFFLVEREGWDVVGDRLVKEFTFAGFAEAVGFVTSVAVVAEAMNHHPDVDVRWNKVTIASTTHDAGGLTTLDIHLAARIDDLA